MPNRLSPQDPLAEPLTAAERRADAEALAQAADGGLHADITALADALREVELSGGDPGAPWDALALAARGVVGVHDHFVGHGEGVSVLWLREAGSWLRDRPADELCAIGPYAVPARVLAGVLDFYRGALAHG